MSLKAEEFPVLTQTLRDRFQKGETLDQLLPEAFGLGSGGSAPRLGRASLRRPTPGRSRPSSGKNHGNEDRRRQDAFVGGRGVPELPSPDWSSYGHGQRLLGRARRQMDEPVYDYLGVSVGWVLSAMDPEARQPHYAADITYATNNELGFDYLRDNMRWTFPRRCNASPITHY